MYDMSNLKKLKTLGELAPAAWEGFMAFDNAAMADGAIPTKMKELIAVAVALTTQCRMAQAMACQESNVSRSGSSEAWTKLCNNP
jgi:alkylhydroperoxidase/carboxymuconolactone decarboxylase family protein YurZ